MNYRGYYVLIHAARGAAIGVWGSAITLQLEQRARRRKWELRGPASATPSRIACRLTPDSKWARKQDVTDRDERAN